MGLDKVKPLGGGKVTIAPAEIARAEKLRAQYLQAAVGTRKLVVKRQTVEFAGNLDKDFAGAEIVRYKKQDDAAVRSAAAWDEQHLYLGWEVRDATPWLNAASVSEQMYTGGDTVDFQLGADAFPTVGWDKVAQDAGGSAQTDRRASNTAHRGQRVGRDRSPRKRIGLLDPPLDPPYTLVRNAGWPDRGRSQSAVGVVSVSRLTATFTLPPRMPRCA